MNKRITFGDLKKVVAALEDNWGPDDKVVVIHSQDVADVLQTLLDDMAEEASVEPFEMQEGFNDDMGRLSALSIMPGGV